MHEASISSLLNAVFFWDFFKSDTYRIRNLWSVACLLVLPSSRSLPRSGLIFPPQFCCPPLPSLGVFYILLAWGMISFRSRFTLQFHCSDRCRYLEGSYRLFGCNHRHWSLSHWSLSWFSPRPLTVSSFYRLRLSDCWTFSTPAPSQPIGVFSRSFQSKPCHPRHHPSPHPPASVHQPGKINSKVTHPFPQLHPSSPPSDPFFACSKLKSPTTPRPKSNIPLPFLDHCRRSQLQPPIFNIVSDRRGGRTAWSSTVTISGNHIIPARFWYDGQYVNNAKEDAAEVALQKLTGAAGMPMTVNGGIGTVEQGRGWAGGR